MFGKGAERRPRIFIYQQSFRPLAGESVWKESLHTYCGELSQTFPSPRGGKCLESIVTSQSRWLTELRFRPLAGESVWKGYQQYCYQHRCWCFRPLAGESVWKVPGAADRSSATDVSVPSRGKVFGKFLEEKSGFWRCLFPSPRGGKCLESLGTNFSAHLCGKSFRPLAGESVWKASFRLRSRTNTQCFRPLAGESVWKEFTCGAFTV